MLKAIKDKQKRLNDEDDDDDDDVDKKSSDDVIIKVFVDLDVFNLDVYVHNSDSYITLNDLKMTDKVSVVFKKIRAEACKERPWLE